MLFTCTKNKGIAYCMYPAVSSYPSDMAEDDSSLIPQCFPGTTHQHRSGNFLVVSCDGFESARHSHTMRYMVTMTTRD